MAHYAFINADNIVVEVITGRNEDDTTGGVTDWEQWYAEQREGLICKRTSYNTVGNEHLFGGVPFRKNYAGIGMIYDAERDAFIEQQPYPSWVLNETTCIWEAPIPKPDGLWIWDEGEGTWKEIENS